MQIAVAYFDTLKTCSLFRLLLFHYMKMIFFRFVAVRKTLILSQKRRWFCYCHSPFCLVKLRYHCELYFSAITMWYSRSINMTMKAPISYEDGVSVRQFLKFTFIYAKFTFEKYHRRWSACPTVFEIYIHLCKVHFWKISSKTHTYLY